MKVAVLGAGPTAMMAALAVERQGHTPVIFARERIKSEVNEDMYLQRPLPDVPGVEAGHPDSVIQYIRRGTSEGYAEKCYGYASAPVSWDRIQWGFGDAWWLEDIYDKLFDRFVGNIMEHFIDPLSIGLITRNYAMTLSTLPAPMLCPNHCTFSFVPTTLVRVRNPNWSPQLSRNEMIYNGMPDGGWFRCSRLRGWITFEYAGEPPEDEVPAGAVVLRGKKFTGNSCSCNPTVARIGRWAQWERGILNHHAYEQTLGVLASAGLGKVA